LGGILNKGSESLLMPSSRGQHFNEGIIFAQLGLYVMKTYKHPTVNKVFTVFFEKKDCSFVEGFRR
jgi:hypothetical protein